VLEHLDPENKPIPRDQLLSLDRIESIRMGTTVSTNALLERKGERCALVTSKGWKNVLEIGMQGKCNSHYMMRPKFALAQFALWLIDSSTKHL
jgi:N-methylhydantoinase A/oxoprolinase/acetone carboxylase beta subunit